MLRYAADRKTLVYMLITTALLVYQWSLDHFVPWLVFLSCVMGVTVSVIAHNHNHLGVFRSKTLNRGMDYWLTLFYGFPAFGWIPTHNMNHHKENNRSRDYTVTWRFTEANNLLTLLTYPTISGFYQQKPIRDYLKLQWSTNRSRFWFYASQYALLGAFIVGALVVDWRKALLLVVLPQQVALFSVLIFNYVQHVHCDEESDINHSRNIVGWGLNALLFNNGFHTIHHMKPGLHWSETPKAHAELVSPHIDPSLNEQSFWWFIVRVYILSLVVPSLKSQSMRLKRISAAA